MTSFTASEQKQALFELRKRLRRRLEQVKAKKPAEPDKDAAGPKALEKAEAK